MSRAAWILIVISVALTLGVVFLDREPAPWEGPGKVFRGLEPDDVVEIAIGMRQETPGGDGVADGKAGARDRSIVLRREGAPVGWYIVEPIRFRAFHPRVLGIVYAIVDLVRVAEAPPDASAFPRGPEISVRMRTRTGQNRLIEVGMDHPDPSLDFSYVRVDGQVFVTRKEFRRTLTVTVEELRSRAILPVAYSEAMELAVEGEPKFARRIVREPATERWRLKEPLDALADREATEGLLRDLNAWTVARFESDEAKTSELLKPYGLDVPAARITVRHREGYAGIIEIGKVFQSAGGSMTYVRHAGTPFVFSAKADVLDQVFSPPEKFRSRFVFQVGLVDFIRLRIDGGGRAFEARLVRDPSEAEGEGDGVRGPEGAAGGRPSGRWVVVDLEEGTPPSGREPSKTDGAVSRQGALPGDKERIETILADLRQLLIQKFVGSEVTLEDAGLSPPLIRVKFETTDGRESELLLGKLCEDPDYRDLTVYRAATPGEPGSYLVRTSIPALAAEGAISLRDRSLSQLEPQALLEFEVRFGGNSWWLSRVPGDRWRVSSTVPLLPGKDLNQQAADALARSLEAGSFRAEKFVPDTVDFALLGLELMDPKKAIVLLRPDDLKGFRKLVLGEPVKGSEPPEVYARVDVEATPPFTLAADGVPRLFDALVRELRDITGLR